MGWTQDAREPRMETGAFDQTTNRPRRSEKTRGRRHPCRVSGGRPPPRERKSLLLCSSLSRLSRPFPAHPTGRLLRASVASRDRTARRCRMRQDGSANTTETKEEWPLAGREMQRWMTGGARKAAPGCSTFQLGRQRTFLCGVSLCHVTCRLVPSEMQVYIEKTTSPSLSLQSFCSSSLSVRHD